MKPRDYCCCAIPVINAGIYFTLAEQFVAGILVGVLSISTPSIVGAVTPSFAPWVLGIVCFVAGAVQVLGFIGVAKEKPVLFRRYIALHSLATTGAFSVALAWIIMSALRHSTAKTNCLSNFFANATSDEQTEGNVLCEVFPWVDVGIMAGLWVVLASLHFYLYIVIASYSTGQQRDHASYDTLDNYAANNHNENFAMNSRFSGDTPYQQHNVDNHLRKQSATSMSEVLAEPPIENYQMGSYPPPSQRVPTQPSNAYTQDESPTPRFGQQYYGEGQQYYGEGSLEKPPFSQAHPGE
ncbi:hypothetical protein GGX14DRAFT_638677 [Mycena pura]|uniref:Transmembrane protein n=1 Tax=Mycena pura TaxID=153505 RepID=A0AAD6YPA5_9AGAR|nr:hypothetical protein GGX14DRAFT_638677 [Mycena pura]